MPKETAFPISSTQRASLDDSIKELVKRRNDQREELIKEFELKYDLVYNNCRRKNQAIVYANGKKLEEKNVVHFLDIEVRVKDLEKECLAKENQALRKILNQYFVEFLLQKEEKELQTDRKGYTISKVNSDVSSKMKLLEQENRQVKNELSELSLPFSSPSEDISSFDSMLEGIDVEVVQLGFQLLEKKNLKATPLLKEKISLMVKTLNDNEEILGQRNEELDEHREKIKELTEELDQHREKIKELTEELLKEKSKQRPAQI